MKKRIVKKHFHKIAKKAIKDKDNSYLFKKYGLYNTFINALNSYLDFILSYKCTKEIYCISNLKTYINNCVNDIRDYIYKKILNKMIHY